MVWKASFHPVLTPAQQSDLGINLQRYETSRDAVSRSINLARDKQHSAKNSTGYSVAPNRISPICVDATGQSTSIKGPDSRRCTAVPFTRGPCGIKDDALSSPRPWLLFALATVLCPSRLAKPLSCAGYLLCEKQRMPLLYSSTSDELETYANVYLSATARTPRRKQHTGRSKGTGAGITQVILL